MSSTSILELRRTEHAFRLGLAHLPIRVLDPHRWKEAAKALEGSAIVEAIVRQDYSESQTAWPSRHEVRAELAKRFRFVYSLRSQPDHPSFPLRWTGAGAPDGPCRTWLVVSDAPLNHDGLTAELMDRQFVAERAARTFVHHPSIRAGLTAVDLGGGFAALEGETERYVLRGVEADTALAIGSEHDAEEVAAVMVEADRWSAEEVHFALGRLAARGLIEEAGARFGDWEEDFWRSAGVSRAVASRNLAEAAVAIVGPLELRQAVAQWGLRVVASDDATVELVAVQDYLDTSVLQPINRRALDTRRPWMLARLTGRIAWIGPVFRPGVTACWSCLAQRLLENRPTGLGPGTASPAVAAGLAASSLARWIGCGGGWIQEHLITFDTWRLEHQSHPVLRHPRCAECGTVPAASSPEQARIVLEDRTAEPLEETARRLRGLVSRVTGIIPEVRAMHGAEPLHVYFGRVNGALYSKANAAARRNDSWQAMGKSRDRLRAEVACMAEAVERHSAGFHEGEPLVRRRWRDWKPGEAVHPSTVVIYSERQQRDRAAWNAKCGRSNCVFPPFDEESEAEWRPVWSITHDRVQWLAAGQCFTDYPWDNERQFCLGDSNGCAAGQNKTDALLRGLLELIERDAVAIWWYNRLARPAVREGREIVDAGRALLAARQRTLEVLDLTNDLQVPAAVAVSSRIPEGDQILLGFGADLSLTKAVEKAVDELCLLLPWPGERIEGEDWTRWWREARVENEPWLRPSEQAATERQLPFRSNSVADAVRTIEQRLGECDLELLACDLTREDAVLPVVRAIVPGLRHFHAQLGPGRLYDVPVRLRWLTRATPEAELNPFLFPL